MSHCANLIRAATFVLLATLSIGAGAQSEIERPNSARVFVGNTQNGSSHGFTLRAEYEFRLTKLIGVGGFLEHASGDIDSVSVAAPVTFHPLGGWAFKVAPGLDFNGGTNLMFRIGAGYDFEIVPRWSLTPEFNIDFVDGETELVYGLSAAYEF